MYDRIICFVNCHFAAHLEAVNKRNADFDHIFRTMTFTRSTNFFGNAAGMLRCLYLSCSLLFSIYLFWLLYSFGLPWLLIFAAGVSSANQMLRGSNVRMHCIFQALKNVSLCSTQVLMYIYVKFSSNFFVFFVFFLTGCI